METPPLSDPVAHVQGLFVQHLSAVRGFVISLLSDFSLADDVIQETFLTITAKAADFERGTNFRAWAMKIAKYKTLQLLEKSRRAKFYFAPEVIEALSAHQDAETFYTEEQLQQLKACMASLAPRARELVELRYEQAQRPPEIARLVGWSVDAVHVALSKARVSLRDCVTKRLAQNNPAF